MFGETPPRWRLGTEDFGEGMPPLVIAEIGMNHNGDLETAHALVDAAAESGAGAVKFQMRNLDNLYGQNPKLEDIGAKYVYDIVSQFSLRNQDLFRLFDYAHKRNLLVLCTAFDEASLVSLEGSSVDGLKIASADFVNHELLNMALATGLPVLMSTGMTSEGELVGGIRNVRSHAGHNQAALLHCNSTYPAPTQDLNLRYIGHIAALSELVVGYSGHERGIACSLAAVAMGASIVERHITLDVNAVGPDHKASLLPDDFRALCRGVQDVHVALGSDGPKVISQGEMMNRMALGKSLVAARELPRGSHLQDSDIIFRSPGTGLPPYKKMDLVGRTLANDVAAGEPLTEELVFGGQRARDSTFHFGRPWGIPVRFHDAVKLATRFEPDFLEFHLGRDDLEATFELPRNLRGKFALKVHSPDIFAGDHILDPSSENVEYAMTSVLHLERVVRLTRTLEAQFKDEPPVIIASFGGFTVHDRLSKSEQARSYERLASRLAAVDLDGVRLSIQTLPPFPWYLGGQLHCNLFLDAPSIESFAEETGFQICLDVSHLQMSCTWRQAPFLAEVRRILPHANHLHLADAAGLSGEGLQIGEGDLDIPALAKLLDDHAPQLPFIPEIWQGHLRNGSGFDEALRRLSIHLT